MFNRLIGKTATSVLARHVGGLAGGPGGRVLGMALPFVARRLGASGMVAMAVGAWGVNRLLAARAQQPVRAPDSSGVTSGVSVQPGGIGGDPAHNATVASDAQNASSRSSVTV